MKMSEDETRLANENNTIIVRNNRKAIIIITKLVSINP